MCRSRSVVCRSRKYVCPRRSDACRRLSVTCRRLSDACQRLSDACRRLSNACQRLSVIGQSPWDERPSGSAAGICVSPTPPRGPACPCGRGTGAGRRAIVAGMDATYLTLLMLALTAVPVALTQASRLTFSHENHGTSSAAGQGSGPSSSPSDQPR